MLKRIRDLLSFATRPRDLEDTAPLSATAATGAQAAEPTLPPAIHHGPKIVHQPIPEGDLDPDAVKIVRRLARFDHTAYLVGGCVRDLLIGRRPKDFDIATTATPRQVRRAFSNCRIIGRRFRLAHVYFQNGKVIEVATFRARDVRDLEEPQDAPGQDGEEIDTDLLIRDDNVFGTPEEDALRRDFTINALFYDVNSGNVIDHAEGLADLRRRLVRTIGEPRTRFREDPIRILRAVKFAARLGFSIEPETRTAMEATRHEIPKAAPPRILEEINRFCRGGAGRASFDLMRETGILDVLLPELAPAYAANPARWIALQTMLDAIDARVAAQGDVETGWILSTLLFPTLLDTLGWGDDGRVQGRRGAQMRELAEPTLRPLALRLRVSRRDQEHTRQVLLALQRMVPAHHVRRSLVHSLTRRPAFADALATLQRLGALLGGDVAQAATFWGEAAAGHEPALPVAAPTQEPEDGAREGTGRRRRRRGGRGRGRATRPAGEGQTTEVAVEPAREERAARAPEGEAAGARRTGRERTRTPRPETRPGMPPPWDDNYFFAALPTVPDLGDIDPGDRYGAGTIAAAPAEPPEDGTPADGSETSSPGSGTRRRRRRRPRHRRVAGEPGGTAD